MLPLLATQRPEFATAMEQLTHRACPILPEEHIRRESGKAFSDGIENPDIRIHVLLGSPPADT